MFNLKNKNPKTEKRKNEKVNTSIRKIKINYQCVYTVKN